MIENNNVELIMTSLLIRDVNTLIKVNKIYKRISLFALAVYMILYIAFITACSFLIYFIVNRDNLNFDVAFLELCIIFVVTGLFITCTWHRVLTEFDNWDFYARAVKYMRREVKHLDKKLTVLIKDNNITPPISIDIGRNQVIESNVIIESNGDNNG